MNPKLKAAKAAMASGQLRQSEALCRQILKNEPQDAAALTLLGTVLSKAGRFEESVRTLQSASQADKGSTEALNHLAQTLSHLGRLAPAVYAARKAIERCPEDASAHAVLGRCLMRLNKNEEALLALEAACRLNPMDVGSQNHLGGLCLKLGEYDKAKANLRNALETAPHALQSRLTLARVLFVEQRFLEAIECLEVGLEYAPNDAELHFALGIAMFDASDADGAPLEADGEAHLRRSIALRPSGDKAYSALGMRLTANGHFAEAKEMFEKSLQFNPNQGHAYLEIVRTGRFTQAQRGLLDRMEDLAKRETVSGKQLTYLHYAIAKAHDDLDEVEAAMAHYDAANRLSHQLHRTEHPFDQQEYSERFALTRQVFSFKGMLQMSTQAEMRPVPILIVGVMRSGTTLVEQILSSHPAVGACGELGFWQTRGASTYRSSRELPSTEEVDSLAKEYLKLLGDLVGPKVRCGTDKMPQNYEFLGLFHLAFPTAPIIYISRNPVDTCLSIYTTPYGTPPEFAYDKADIAFIYEEHLKIMEHWRSVLPSGRIHEITYEDLVSNPEHVIRRMLEYCRLDWNDACLNHKKNDRVVNTPNRWEVRQSLYGSSVDRWKRYESHVAEFKYLL